MSEKKYFRQQKPFQVPTSDGKSIAEHFGLASTRTPAYSVAHMIAPPYWSEPHQNPEFDEITIVIRGRKMAEVDGEEVILEAGQTLLVKQGARVKYSNPFDQETEYWSVCVPAFDISTVHRED